MLTQSSKERLADLEKAYRKLVDDQDVAQATVDAYADKLSEQDAELEQDSAYLFTLSKVLENLFDVMAYGDFATWTKLIPREGDKPETYAYFFMLDRKSEVINRQVNEARGPLRPRRDPFYMQIGIDQGNMALDYNKKMIFVYGEDDPWTGGAIPDPTNPNVRKYIVPHGAHDDDLQRFAWYPGGKEVADQILADVRAILFP